MIAATTGDELVHLALQNQITFVFLCYFLSYAIVRVYRSRLYLSQMEILIGIVVYC